MRKSSPRTSPGLAAIVLAAGASRRLGRPKQLLQTGGEPLILRAVRLGQGVIAGRVRVVVGAGQLRIRSVLQRRGIAAAIVCNRDWRKGMASSLSAGLRHLARRDRGALILLVDQPALSAADIGRLVRRWRRRPGQPAAAHYAGRHGAPAIIPQRLFSQAARLRGDTGARQLLRELGTVTAVAMPAAACDIDTPAAAGALERTGRRRLV
jgi:CTP:molybdopterin cytidylyltransferase MocA